MLLLYSKGYDLRRNNTYKGCVTMEVVEIVEEKLSMFKNLYDNIRIVDPISKKVISIQEDNIKVVESNCYELWEKNEYCRNCIAMRAYLQNDTLLKMEFADGKVFLITALPVIIEDNTYIVELIRRVSQSENAINNETNTYKVQNLLDEMNDAVITDKPTGTYNRKYINERLIIDMNDSIIYNQPLCVITVDLDFFKNVNDTYGHAVGDLVLKDFAKILSTSIKDNSAWVGRYGGEEFLIVLRNTDVSKGFKVAEKIRKLVEEKVFVYNDIKIKITASFGACSVTNPTDKKLNIDEFINKADRNLHLAKSSGRNKTVIN
jgi:two-component system cell cycle response regulator